MKKVMGVACGSYMDSGYGFPGEWRCLRTVRIRLPRKGPG